MSTNTRMTYTASRSNYQDQREVTILRGELTPEQIRRLGLSIFFNRIDSLIESCGLIRLPNNGTGISLGSLSPTLESPTNPRVDAQAFFDMARVAFARQAVSQDRLPNGVAILEKHIAKFRGKPADEQLSDKGGMLGGESDRQRIGGWLQALLMGPMAAGAYLSPLHLPIPESSSVLESTFGDMGNIEALVSIDAAWPTVMGNDTDGALVKRALTNGAPLTAGEAVRAFEATKRYIASVETLVARAS